MSRTDWEDFHLTPDKGWVTGACNRNDFGGDTKGTLPANRVLTRRYFNKWAESPRDAKRTWKTTYGNEQDARELLSQHGQHPTDDHAAYRRDDSD